MKIRYDGSGNINAATIDSAALGGATVITIPDNAALLQNPWKYTWNTGSSSLVLREAVVLTTTAPLTNGIPSAAANGVASIVVTLTAYNTAGVVDTAANFVVNLTDLNARGAGSPISPVTLVSGVGSATFTSATAKRMMLSAQSAGVLNGNLSIAFI
jgi:hypothetical protein